MLRRVAVAASLAILLILTAAAGLAQTWPECLTGCTAKDVEVLGAYLADAASGCDVQLLIQAKRQNTYCIVLSCTVEYTDTGGTPQTESVVYTVDYLAGGIQDLTIANVDCLGGTGVSVTDIYIAWSPNDQTCEEDCTDYGPGSKCNGTTPDLPALTGGDILVIKDAVPDYPASFGFSSATLSPSAFTLIDDGTGGNTQEFSDVADGTYIIYESSLPSGWSLENISVIGTAVVTFGSGTNYTRSSFNASRGDDGVRIVIDEASDFAVITFENSIDAGTLTVTKYEDLNRNGARDTSPSLEPVLAGWTIEVYQGTGCDGPNTLVASGTTAADGTISFELPVGTYYVTEQLPTGWINTQPGTTPPCATAVITEGAQSNVLFGNAEQPGSITVHKYNDLNGNGSDDTEPALEGWTITLHSESGCQTTEIASAVTDASGNVTFSSLTPGTYYVSETLQAGWQNTEPGTGSTAPCVEVTLSPGGSPSVGLGNRQIPGSISVHKYEDINGNGSDETEPSLEGWTINLYSAPGCSGTPIASSATDSSGNVTFSSLSPGTYYISETLQAGWQNTDPGTSPPCVEVTLSAEGSPAVDLGNRQLPGAITIQKVTLTSTTELFTFNHDDIGGQTTFDLGSGDTEVFGSVAPGTYVFTEQALAGWSIFDISKQSGDATVRFGSSGSFHDTYQPGDSQVEIVVGANQSALIVFTNEQSQQDQFGSITVTKDVVPNDASLWTITLDGANPQTLADGGSFTYAQLTPGTYTVAEAGPPGYNPLVTVGSDGGTASTGIVVSIGPGENKTVAFTNTLRSQGDDGWGGGGGGGTSSGCYNNNPIPNAGPDQVGCVGERICLDGSASYDPDENLPENFPGSANVSPMYRHQPRETLRFSWTFAIHHYENGRAVLDVPRGSRVLATIEGFDTEFPCFSPDLPGRYVLVLTVTDDYGASLMDQVTVAVEDCDHLVTRRFPTGWQLVSAPLHPADTSVGTLNGIPSSEVQLFRYRGDYIAADSFALGVGYWMYVPEPIVLSIIGLPVESSYSIHLLSTGWHLIGTPFPAAWDQTRVEFDGQTWNVDDAARRGIIENLCVGTAADGTYTLVDALLPWNGYWVYIHEPSVVLHLHQMPMLSAPLFWTAPPALYTPPGPPQLSAGSAELNVTPNPSRHRPVLFSVGGLVAVDEIRVRIYDMAGHIIWDASASDRELVWDTVRDDGHEAARGAYIYTVEIRHENTWSLAGRDVLLLAPSDQP
ncbi:hypothetical protein JW848_01925 [Candidatus Bipolaricaulota bacterium]|nr:hypothetical protein [Candidatus Bipolaricaulota bacterium]